MTRCSSASVSRPTPRCAGWPRPGCSARWPTAPAAGSTPRSGCCPPARSRWSPGPARTARATRPPGARSSRTQLGVPFEDIRVLHGDTQVSPKGMDTYGSRSLTVGGVAVHGACEKVIAKAKVIAARHAGGAARGHGVRRRPVRGARATRRGQDHPGDRAGHLRRARPAGRRGARRWTPTPPSTRTTSPTRTARTCARPRWTPRPGGRRSAPTWPWTTWARWSTR